MLVGLMIIIGVVVCIQMISNLNLHRLYRVYICNKLFALILSFSIRIAEPEPHLIGTAPASSWSIHTVVKKKCQRQNEFNLSVYPKSLHLNKRDSAKRFFIPIFSRNQPIWVQVKKLLILMKFSLRYYNFYIRNL